MSTFFPVTAKPIQIEVILPSEPVLSVPAVVGTYTQDLLSSGSGMCEVIIPKIVCSGSPGFGSLSLIAIHSFNSVTHHILHTKSFTGTGPDFFSTAGFVAADSTTTDGMIYQLNPGMTLRLVVQITSGPGTTASVTSYVNATKYITAA